MTWADDDDDRFRQVKIFCPKSANDKWYLITETKQKLLLADIRYDNGMLHVCCALPMAYANNFVGFPI